MDLRAQKNVLLIVAIKRGLKKYTREYITFLYIFFIVTVKISFNYCSYIFKIQRN